MRFWMRDVRRTECGEAAASVSSSCTAASMRVRDRAAEWRVACSTSLSWW